MKINKSKRNWLISCGVVLICLFSAGAIYYSQVQALLVLVENAGEEARFTNQAVDLQKLLRLEPWRNELVLQIAEGYYQAEDFPNAVIWYSKAKNETPLGYGERMRYGQALVRMGKTDEAEKVFQELAALPNLGETDILALAQELRKLGNFEAALSTLNHWLEAGNKPDAAMAWQISMIEATLHPETALPVLLKLSTGNYDLREKLTPMITFLDTPGMSKSELWAGIGRFLLESREWDLSELAFIKSTNLTPSDSEGWAMLGESRLMQKKDGYPDLVKATRLNDRSRLGRYFLAIYWRERGQTELARKYLESLNAEEPRESLWLVELAKTEYAAGDTAGALQNYQSAAAIDPENLEVWQALAEFSLANAIDLNGAGESAVQRTLLLSPDDPVSNDLMAWLLLGRGDPDNALKFLAKSIASDPSSARSHLHYAQALWGIGDASTARKEFISALGLDPDGPVGLTANRLLKQYFPGQ
jgi:tetratricopeptide (TPR) repeat protein